MMPETKERCRKCKGRGIIAMGDPHLVCPRCEGSKVEPPRMDPKIIEQVLGAPALVVFSVKE